MGQKNLSKEELVNLKTRVKLNSKFYREYKILAVEELVMEFLDIKISTVIGNYPVESLHNALLNEFISNPKWVEKFLKWENRLNNLDKLGV